jgi:hypothetical protein
LCVEPFEIIPRLGDCFGRQLDTLQMLRALLSRQCLAARLVRGTIHLHTNVIERKRYRKKRSGPLPHWGNVPGPISRESASALKNL